MMELKNKVVVVTGGGNGIGEALVRRFDQEGGKALVVADLDGDAASRVAEAVGGTAFQVDVASESEIAELIGRVE